MNNVAEFIDAIFGVAVLTSIWSALLWPLVATSARALTAYALSLFTATILAAYGLSDVGNPDFAFSFAKYAIPQIIVLASVLWWSGREMKRPNVEESGQICLTMERTMPSSTHRPWPRGGASN